MPGVEPNRSQLLDWFRGLGITAVVWGHAGLPGLSGAYLFIDCFFVISGFLVTQSFQRLYLKTSGDAGTFPRVLKVVGVFYQNRICRILIPLCAAVSATLVVGWFILLPDDLVALAESAKATLLLQAHLYGLGLGNYFTNVANQAPLLHAWSLSLEEQFYIITPLLVIPSLIWSRILGLGLLACLAGLSLWHAQHLSSDPSNLGASYYLFQTRVWEFIGGVLLALVTLPQPKISAKVNDAFICFGLVLIFGSVVLLTPKAASPGLITLPVLLGMAIILVSRERTHSFSTIVRMPLAAAIGKKLYSIYLFHYPIIIYFNYVDIGLGPYSDYIKFLLAMIGGVLAFYAVEKPWGGWRHIRFRYVIGTSVVAYTTILASGVWVTNSAGAPDRMPTAAQVAWNHRFAINPLRAECLEGHLTQNGYSCLIGTGNRPFVAIVGDSHSDAIAQPFAEAFDQRGYDTRHYWFAECPALGSGLADLAVFSDTCEKLSFEAHRDLLQAPNLVGVVYALRWPWYLDDATAENSQAYWRGANGVPGHYASMEEFRSDLSSTFRSTLAAFEARGVDVFVLSPVPVMNFDPVRRAALANWYTASSPKTASIPIDHYREQLATFDDFMASLLQDNPTIWSVEGALCDEAHCFSATQDAVYYYDDNHLNQLGARRVRDFLFE